MKPRVDMKIVAASAALAAVALSAFLVHTSMSLKKERVLLKEQQKELLHLREDFLSLRTSLDAAGTGKNSAKTGGIVQAVDEIFRSVGLSQKVKSVKSAGVRERKYATEEEADVQVEKLTMNEMANIFYRIENGPALLSLRKTTIRTNFENPSLLNITMTIDLVKPK